MNVQMIFRVVIIWSVLTWIPYHFAQLKMNLKLNQSVLIRRIFSIAFKENAPVDSGVLAKTILIVSVNFLHVIIRPTVISSMLYDFIPTDEPQD